MKKILNIWLLCVVTVYVFGQDFCRYVNDRKVCYEVSDSKMFVKSVNLGEADIKNELQVAGSLILIIPCGNDGLFLIEMRQTSKANMLELVRQWNEREDVIYASPLLLDEKGQEVGGYTNEVVVRVKSKDDYPVLQRCAEKYQIKNITINEFDVFTYTLTLPHNPAKSAIDIANELHESGLFEYADPNFNLIGSLGTMYSFPHKESGLFNIYPNPVNDVFYVTLDKVVSYDILLYNNQGKLLRQVKVKDGIIQLNVSNLPEGIYFLHIYDIVSAARETFKIFVKH